MKKPPHFFLLLLLILPCWLWAQPEGLSFLRIGAKDGLSQSFVHCLLKESQGFVWAGTQDGLNRFDGYRFQAFYKEQSNPHSLSNNYIWTLEQDHTGNIWMGTNGGGLCLYESAIQRFSTFLPDHHPTGGSAANSVRSIFETRSGKLLVGTEAGLYIFDHQNEQFTPIKNAGSDFTKSIFSIERMTDDLLLIGSVEAILLYEEKSETMYQAKLSPDIAAGIHCFSIDSSGHIWAGTGKGLFLLHWVSGTDSLAFTQQFRSTDSMAMPISSSYISSLLTTSNGGLWIGTNNGLNYLNTQKPSDGFVSFQNDPENDQSLSNNLIFDLLEVEPGIIWAATNQGINQFYAKAPVFKSFNLEKSIPLVCGTSVHGMVETPDGRLLACTEKGLVQLSLDNSSNTDNLQCWGKTRFPQMEDEFLVNITPGQSGSHWVALRRGGYAELVSEGNNFQWKSYQLPAGAYKSIGTNDFVEDANGDLWIASSGLGLWKHNLQTGVYTSFAKSEKDSLSLSGNYIFALLEDSRNNLWVATADGGLCRMDKANETFVCYTHQAGDPESISSNLVLFVFEDSRDRIWVCTADGLNLFSSNGKFTRFHSREGLPNNVIYGILEDDQQQLWVSTDNGIARISYENDLFQSQNFSKADGLLNSEFNQHAFARLSSGQLVFGTKGGFNFFQPADISAYTVLPQIALTDFKLFNESVIPLKTAAKGKFSLKNDINFTEYISLPYDKNFVAFEFTGINFEQAPANQYAYQMQGLDQDWVYCGDRRFANYPGLKPGNYTFQVKVSNHDGLWNEQIRSVRLLIKNPPWKTWWAYLLYFLSAFSIIYSLFKYRLYTIRQIEKTKQEERTRFRKRSAQDFHDEAGNQITKISLMTEVAKRKATNNNELKDLLTQVEENVQALRLGMRDFIWVLDSDNDNLYEMLLRLKDFANDIFEYSPIIFSTSGLTEELKAIPLNGTQRRHLLLIFKEAINNCLKYSNAKNAWFRVSQNGSILELQFSDDGIGMDVNEPGKGQGLQNIKARAEKIKVDYHFSAEKNKGTTLRILFNTTQMGH